jgi:DNA-binding transcriptional ArsR family regulator
MEDRSDLLAELVPALPALDVLDTPTRRRIVYLLAHGPASVRWLSRVLDQSQPLVSKHLRVLLEAGLLDVDQSAHDGRIRLYRLRREPFAHTEAWLADIRTTWHRTTRHHRYDEDERQ